nr:C-Myc-binding protein isoform X2 [Vicugna pacos]
MAYYKAADSKREQFRRYLEKSGVLDTLTKVLVALYEEPEKPNSALEYPFHFSSQKKFFKASLRSCYPRKSRNRAASPRIGRNEREI